MTRPAVFLDRDGTIVDDPPPGYLNDPARVTLFPGVVTAIARLNATGMPVVLVTNQAGIARGQITVEQYQAVAVRIERLLSEGGARLDATYMCPHAPDVGGPCPCRKPGLLLFERAAADLDLDMPASWWLGDRITDLIPSERWGGRGFLVLTGLGAEHRAAALERGYPVVADVKAAVDAIFEAGARTGA